SVASARTELEREKSIKQELENELVESNAAAAAKLEQVLAKAQAGEQRSLSESREFEARLSEVGSARHDAESRVMELSVKLSEVQGNLNSVRNELKHCETEREDLQVRLSEAAEVRSESEKRLKEAAERFARAEESIAMLHEELSAAENVREELEARVKE